MFLKQSQAIDVIGILVPCGLGIIWGMLHRWTGSENTSTYTPEVKHNPWKMMVGRLLSYWDPVCFQGFLLLSFQGGQLLAVELLRLSSCKSQEYVGELSATIESHLLLISPRCILCLAYTVNGGRDGGLFVVFLAANEFMESICFAFTVHSMWIKFLKYLSIQFEWTYETCKSALQHLSLAAWWGVGLMPCFWWEAMCKLCMQVFDCKVCWCVQLAWFFLKVNCCLP